MKEQAEGKKKRKQSVYEWDKREENVTEWQETEGTDKEGKRKNRKMVKVMEMIEIKNTGTV